MFIFGTVIIVGFTNIYLLIPTAIIGIMVYKVRDYYFYTSQNIKRLEAASKYHSYIKHKFITLIYKH